jgi:SAM-dependent methyltransferase
MASEAIDQSDQELFADRLLGSLGGAIDVYTVYLGDRLGLYRALAEGRGRTPHELAAETGTHERYVREWCEQQVIADILAVADPTAPASERRYSLPEAHVEVLTDTESLNFLAPIAQLFVGSAAPVCDVADAFRTGGGVPFEEYGEDLREGLARTNRASFLSQLGEEWLPAVPDVDASLRTVGARVADIGCGHGYSAIGIARAYPTVDVDAFDLDAASVTAARENVADAGLEDRVTVHHRDAATLDDASSGNYDLVTAFECVHDLSDPVGVLGTMRRLAGEDGSVIVADERTGESFADESDIEWLLYGFSILHCLPVGLAHEPSAATGTVMRPATLESYAEEAGFDGVDVLPIEHFFWRFYRLSP